MSVRVAIVMPVLDGRHLHLAVQSIQEQTFTDWELFVIDDGTDDGARADLDRVAVGDRRVRVMRNEHTMGVTRSLNHGLSLLGQHSFVARHDADDISAPRRLEEQIAILDAEAEVGVVGCVPAVIDDDGTVVGRMTLPVDSGSVAATLPSRNPVCHGSALIRRSVLDSTGPYRSFFATSQDLDLWTRVIERAAVVNLEGDLYSLRVHDRSVSRRRRHEQLAYTELIADLAHARARRGRDALGLQYGGTHVEGSTHGDSAPQHFIVGTLAYRSGRYMKATAHLARSSVGVPAARRRLVQMARRSPQALARAVRRHGHPE